MVNFKFGPASRSLSLILGIFELINKESRGITLGRASREFLSSSSPALKVRALH